VTGAAIANGTITSADLAVAPRAASVPAQSGGSLGQNQTVRSVSLTTAGAGTVIVNASGDFAMQSTATLDSATCSITTGTVLDFSHRMNGAEASAASLIFMPFGGTRAFNVNAGTTTFNLVCSRRSRHADSRFPAFITERLPLAVALVLDVFDAVRSASSHAITPGSTGYVRRSGSSRTAWTG
jgi:hypothetical protein